MATSLWTQHELNDAKSRKIFVNIEPRIFSVSIYNLHAALNWIEQQQSFGLKNEIDNKRSQFLSSRRRLAHIHRHDIYVLSRGTSELLLAGMVSLIYSFQFGYFISCLRHSL